VAKLLEVLHELVDQGNTVVVIEHNLEVIKTADYVIDLGPEGGDGGGEVVATGTPEQVAKVAESYTGHYLKQLLDRRGGSPKTAGAKTTRDKAASSKATNGRRATRGETTEAAE
jgi:excinuclease ABC subunit A